MSEITEVIPGLGSPPLTTDPATFDPRADTLYGTSLPATINAINVWREQANELAAEVNSNANASEESASSALDSRNAAVGAANFKGEWGALSGELAIPASASWLGTIWVLTENVADVAAHEPSPSSEKWTPASSPPVRDYQEFSSSGTYTIPDGASILFVQAIGGGGSGGNDLSGANVGGGSGGEFVESLLMVSDLGATETVTVGSGAIGGATGSDNEGSQGGSTSFGSLLTARGGLGGVFFSAATPPPGTASGTGSIALYPSLIFPFSGYGGWTTNQGGNSTYGGAGGGGAGNGAGGVSVLAGNGGAGNDTASTPGGNGVAPGGAGGGCGNDGGGGNGGQGIVRIWAW